MSKDGLGIRDDFSSVSDGEWRERVEKDLKGGSFEKRLVGRTFEGIAVQPLYGPDAQEEPLSEARNLTSGGGAWQSWLFCGHASASECRKAIVEHEKGGGDSVLLHMDRSVRTGSTARAPVDGFVARNAADFVEALADVSLAEKEVILEAGMAAPAVVTALAAAAEKSGLDPGQIGGALNMDPLGALAADGVLPSSLVRCYDLMGGLGRRCVRQTRPLTPFGVSSAPYHEAGANAVQELGVVLATAIAYMREMEERRHSPDDFSGRTIVTLSVGRDMFMEIAKLRAFRALWSRMLEACDVAPANREVFVHARASRRTKTARDPWVNMLRGTTDCVVGAIGGAQAISLSSFDEPVGEPEEMGRRVARNTHHLLMRESGLHRVMDAAGGSWYVEHLTSELVDAGWAFMQEIESRGGMAAVLGSGWLAERIMETGGVRAKAVAKRKEAFTGVSEFPKVDEKVIERHRHGVECDEIPSSEPAFAFETVKDWLSASMQAFVDGASVASVTVALSDGAGARVDALEPVRDAAPYEELRDASDRQLAKAGRRPRVFLANMGPIPQHRARAMFSDNLFQAGGFEVSGGDGFPTPKEAVDAFRTAVCDGAVICSTDATYPELVPTVAAGLKEAGARFVVVAGRPGQHEAAWREAGVDVFIHLGCDVLGVLRNLLGRLEVIG